MPIPPPNCKSCGTQMRLREKDGSKFWGCPNYKNCGGKTQSYQGADNAPEGQSRPAGGQSAMNRNQIIGEMLAGCLTKEHFDTRMDALAVFLKNKLG